MTSIEKAFSEKLSLHIGSSDSVLVAFSGGCDSLCLLALCIKALGPKRVFPVYVNHNIRSREELEAEIALNRGNCKALDVELEVFTLNEGLVSNLAKDRGRGVEDAARTLRYEALEACRQRHNCRYIVTAHHRQDQVETIIMRLGRGAPLSSLCGIFPKDEKRSLLRPLLDFSRSELESYLMDRDLRWSTDSTNSESQYLRNHIRNNIVPGLKDIVPDYEDLLLGVRAQAMALTSQDNAPVPEGPYIALSELLDCTLEKRADLIYRMWDSVFCDSEIPQTLVSKVLQAAKLGRDCRIGSNGAIFVIYHGMLYLIDPSRDAEFQTFEKAFDPNVDQCIGLPGAFVLRSGSYAKEALAAPESTIDDSLVLRMDSSSFKGKPVVRFAREGERIYLKGGSKLVGRLLQEMGIPSDLRLRVPVLADSEGLCAVFGTAYGAKDRICVKFRCSLAPNAFTEYIVTKG